MDTCSVWLQVFEAEENQEGHDQAAHTDDQTDEGDDLYGHRCWGNVLELKMGLYD